MKKHILLLSLSLLAYSLINAQVNRVKEINDSGTSNSSPNNLFVYNGKVYFGADDSSGSNTGGEDLGRELWVTDGTEAGTMLVKDLRLGSDSSSPNAFFEFNGTLYFSAQDGITTGNILFSSDGTSAGTSTTGNSFIFNPAELNGLIYYVNTSDGNALYQFDGTNEENVADVGAGAEALIGGTFTVFEDILLCYMDYSTDEATIGRELYEYDPTADTFTLVKDITGDNADASISNFTVLGVEVYFEALNALWKTDGTEAGTIVVDAAATASIAGVNNLYAWNGQLFFEGDDGTGDQLWKYDPGSDMVTNLSAIGGTNNNHDPGDYSPSGDYLYYSAKDANDTDTHLWRTDGTTVEQLDNTIKDVDEITALGDVLLFEGDNGNTGNELYFYIPPVPVKEINDSGTSSSSPRNLFAYNGKVYFGADDSNGSNTGGEDLGRELWVTDGTEAGTVLVKDLRPGSDGSSPSFFFEYNGTLYFSAQDGITTGNVLFSSDGTAAGTVTTGNSFIFNPTELNGLIYYVNTSDGSALYQFDGTNEENVADVGAGVEALAGGIFTAFGDKLLCYMSYSTDEATIGLELYEYNPAEDTFTLVKDITGDNEDASISNFTVLGAEVYFEALNALWKTDGTETGTIAIGAAATASIAGVNNLYAWNGQLFFEGDDGTGDQLWKYDPGSDMVTNLSTIAGTNNNHDPGDYAPASNYLYYSAKDANDTDTHLWRTDGTTIEQLDNTIKDVDEITLLGNILLFEGDNGTTGNELYSFTIPRTLVVDLEITGTATMIIGTAQVLSVSISPAEATDQTVTWSSSDTGIATVDETGSVTAVSVGNVEITAIANDGSGISNAFTITVNPVLVESITISGEAEMEVGATQTLTVTINPGNATDNSVTWASSNTDLATVDQAGLVTAVGAGSVEITATANDGSGVTGSTTIAVTPVILSINSAIIENLNVWPNPATDQVNISLHESIQDVPFSITNIHGKTLTSGTLNSNNSVDLSPYQRGVYFLRVEMEGVHSVFRIVLQ